MWRSGGFAVLCLLLMLGGNPCRARAQLVSVLHLEPGATCLRDGELATQIARRLGGVELAAGLAVEVVGDKKFARFVTIRLLRGDEELAERRFEPGPAACEDLHGAVAMAVALAVKAARESQASTASLASAQGTGAAREPRLRFTLAVLGAAGVLPGLQWGGRLGLAWDLTRVWSARLRANALHAPARALTSIGDFDASSLTGGLQLCAALGGLGRVQSTACAGPDAGALRTNGHGYTPSRDATAAYVGLAADLEVRVELGGRWSIQTQLGVSLPLSRPRFAARDARGLLVATQTLPASGALLAFGLGYEF